MEEQILIQNLKIYPAATIEQAKALMDEMLKNDSREIVLFPDTEKEYLYIGFLLKKYYTPALTETATIRSSKTEGAFHYLTISRHALRAFLQHLTRRCGRHRPPKKA